MLIYVFDLGIESDNGSDQGLSLPDKSLNFTLISYLLGFSHICESEHDSLDSYGPNQ